VQFKQSGDENGFDIVSPGPNTGGNESNDPNNPCINCEGGTDGRYTPGADLFFQKPVDGRVDILLVDDNSGSMSAEQNLLAQRFSTFISRLSGLDWQIGITTTDVTNDPVNGLRGSLLELSGHPGQKILTPSF